MPLFSIIIPVYKTENYLRRCIDSVLSQFLTDFELILIDDGSPDNCGRICDEYARRDKRIKVIHQDNAGVSCARNCGIELACGKYIVFVDSDDWIEPDYLLQLTNSDADFVGHTFSIYDEGMRLVGTPQVLPCYTKIDRNCILRLLQEGALGYVVSKRFKTDIIKRNRIRFEERISHTEDTLFAIDYLQCVSTAEIKNVSSYNYVKYSTRSTLSNQISISRLAMVCVANDLICKKFFEIDSEGYNRLYFSRIGYSYMSYIGNSADIEQGNPIRRYFWFYSLLKNKDIKYIIRYVPDALWKLSINKRMVEAIKKGSNLQILAACCLDAVANYRKKKA